VRERVHRQVRHAARYVTARKSASRMPADGVAPLNINYLTTLIDSTCNQTGTNVIQRVVPVREGTHEQQNSTVPNGNYHREFNETRLWNNVMWWW